MKKNIFLSYFLFVVTLSSAFISDTPEQYLVRKWKLDAETTWTNFEKGFEPGKDPKADELAKGLVKYMIMKIADSTVEYQLDGVLITTTINEKTKVTKVIKGHWSIDKGKKELVLIEDSTREQEQRMKIFTLSNTQLELAFEGPNRKTLVMVYVPVE